MPDPAASALAALSRRAAPPAPRSCAAAPPAPRSRAAGPPALFSEPDHV
ncbi:hypothetical protein OJ998_30815 [Solirubrobacter taibaiensis]|nr:hypothetical protein [Solirubrobacter taibaiensis]